MRATQYDREIAQAFGIDVDRVYAGVFALGAALAAVAAVLVVPISQAHYLMGGDPFYSFIVVIIGGLGSLRGTIPTAGCASKKSRCFRRLPGRSQARAQNAFLVFFVPTIPPRPLERLAFRLRSPICRDESPGKNPWCAAAFCETLAPRNQPEPGSACRSRPASIT